MRIRGVPGSPVVQKPNGDDALGFLVFPAPADGVAYSPPGLAFSVLINTDDEYLAMGESEGRGV